MTNSTNNFEFEKQVYAFKEHVEWQHERYNEIRGFESGTNWDEAKEWADKNDFHLRFFYKRAGGEWEDKGAVCGCAYWSRRKFAKLVLECPIDIKGKDYVYTYRVVAVK